MENKEYNMNDELKIVLPITFRLVELDLLEEILDELETINKDNDEYNLNILIGKIKMVLK